MAVICYDCGMVARVSTRGRVTIPIELRRKLGLRPGTKLIVREVDNQIVAMTMEQSVRSLRGKFKGKGLMQALREERQYEDQSMKVAPHRLLCNNRIVRVDAS